MCGGTYPPVTSCAVGRVYPRVCGGTASAGGSIRYWLRSIPACAGEPRWEPDRRRRPQSGLSPRVRGNRSYHLKHLTILLKVYPRVCGGTSDLKRLTSFDQLNGSIPACAGEPWILRRFKDVLPGLSPRVRGNRCSANNVRSMIKVYPRVCGGTMNGSIPACAGEPPATRLTVGLTAVQLRVYPRVCGGTPAYVLSESR